MSGKSHTRDALKLKVGERIDFGVTTYYEGFEVVNVIRQEGQPTMLELRSPTGEIRKWPAVRLHTVKETGR